MMEPQILGAIARVLGQDGLANGTASLVGKDLVLTALHVVADRSAADPKFFPGPIRLRFHTGFETTAEVMKYDRLEDWVLLTCTNPPPPPIRPLPLGTVSRDGDEWKSYGFPITTEYSPGHDAASGGATKADGLIIRGVVRARHGKLVVEEHNVPVYQLHCDEVASGQGLRASGFSGAPVIVNGSLVGMLRWSPLEDHRAEGGTLYACPAASIAAKCRDQLPESLKSVSPNYARRATAAAAASLALLAGVYAWSQRTPPPPPRDSTEFVIDSSSRMTGTFDGKTKIAWALEALAGKTSLPTENIALRSFGGDCSAGTSMLMSFRVGLSKDDFRRAANRLARSGEARGAAALLDAVTRAMSDVKAFPNKRRVIVITGGLDECEFKGKEVFAAEIARLKNDKEGDLDLDLHFIAVGAPPDEEEFLKTLPARTGATVSLVHTGTELQAALSGEAGLITRIPPSPPPSVGPKEGDPVGLAQPVQPTAAEATGDASIGKPKPAETGAPKTASPPKATAIHQVIVMDTSKNMDALFEGSANKLDAAFSALQAEGFVLPDDPTGLWKFGGDCARTDGAQRVLPVGPNLLTRLRGRRVGPPQGESTLVFGVLAAVNELQRFSGSRRVIVLTGGDKCPNDNLEELRRRMANAGFADEDLYMRFVGLGASPEGEQNIQQVADATNGEAYFVQNLEELSKVLEWVLKVEPAMYEVSAVWNIVGGPVKGFNQLQVAFKERKFDEAQKIVADVQEAHDSGKSRFDTLAQKQHSTMFQGFYKLAASNRSLDAEALDLAREIIKYGTQLDAAAGNPPDGLVENWNRAVEGWNKNFGDYRDNSKRMQDLTMQMRKELTGR
jgi:hypothetical protein